jgi:hypothetical protein
MNWEAIGAIGELVGGAVVVASLIYLAVQVRQNTNAVRSTTRHAWLSAIQTCNQFALDHSDVWNKGAFEQQELGGEELTRFITLIHSGLNAYETLYSEYLAGNVEDEFWEGKVRQMTFIVSSPSGRAAWVNYTHLFDKRFVKYVNENVVEARLT